MASVHFVPSALEQVSDVLKRRTETQSSILKLAEVFLWRGNRRRRKKQDEGVKERHTLITVAAWRGHTGLRCSFTLTFFPLIQRNS